MTPKQREILQPIFKVVSHHSRYKWWELKREIYDDGYQFQYRSEEGFITPSERALARLSDVDKAILISEWRQENKNSEATTDDSVMLHYAHVIVEEVVRRAAIASSVTINW